MSLSKFEPKNTRYTAAHTLDIYSEVASICRPPLMLAPSEQANVKKTPTTAYIISVYKVKRVGTKSIREIKKNENFQVYEGDDGERFERNWLYWTGEGRMAKVSIVVLRFLRDFRCANAVSLFTEKCGLEKDHVT